MGIAFSNTSHILAVHHSEGRKTMTNAIENHSSIPRTKPMTSRLSGVTMEMLENRRLLSSVVVNTAIDAIFPAGSGQVSLRNAILTANASTTPTTITFSPTAFAAAQTITLNGTELELSNKSEPTTITGPSEGVTISGNKLSTVFQIDSSVTATFSNLTATKGSDSGISGGGILTLTNDTVSDAAGSGIIFGGTLKMTGVSITGNGTANPSDGGGVYFGSGTAALSNVAISGNMAGYGAGLYESGGTVTLTDVTLSGNAATNQAGGMYIGSTATLTNVTVSGNAVPNGAGGGIFNVGTATLNDTTVAGNSSYGGGGIYNSNESKIFTVANSIIAGNSATGYASDAYGAFNSLGHNLVGKTDTYSTGFNAADLTGTVAKPLNAKLGALAANGGFTKTMLPLSGSPAIGAGLVAYVPKGITTDQRGLPRIVNGKVDIGAVEVQPAVTTSIIVIAPAAQTAIKSVSKSISLGKFTESNATGPYKVTVNWGDGSANTTFTATAAGTITAQSHDFATSGSKTVTVSVTDSASHSSNKATFAVTVSAAVLGSITGTVFSDTNANGKMDSGEKGIAGVKVYIDANKNGMLDSGEVTVTTNSSGVYTFNGLAAGTYRIREVLPSGYRLITPTTGYYGAVVTNTAVTGELFADAPATSSISGRVFGDSNGNGKRDVGEIGLGLWTVKLLVGTTTLQTATSDINGNWLFTGLTAGAYKVEIVPVAGDTTTTPSGGIDDITLAAGQEFTGILFGEKSNT
jgi:SdrD B-like domain